MKGILVTIALLALAGCNSGEEHWQAAPQGPQGRLDRAKAICKARASDAQISAGREWILGALMSDDVFRGCMAEQGFVNGN